MKARFRDQASVMMFVGSLLGVLVAFNLGVTDEQAALWMAGINLTFSAVAAAFVRPWEPSTLTGAVSALAALVAGYGFEIAPEKLSAVNLALVMTITFFFIRPNSTPKSSPAIGQGVTSKDVPIAQATGAGRAS